MHLDVEILIKYIVFPFGYDLHLPVASVFRKEVVKCLYCPILGNNIVTPLNESQFHPLLPESNEIAPHPVNSDMLFQVVLLISHVILKASSELCSTLYAWCKESGDLLILVDYHDWIASKFEPTLESIPGDPPVASK